MVWRWIAGPHAPRNFPGHNLFSDDMSLPVQLRRALLRPALLLAALVLISLPAAATASTTQTALFEEDSGLYENPAGTLKTLHDLGVGEVRLFVHWNRIAPAVGSSVRPAGFDATDPGAYPPANWVPLDTIVADARSNGIKLLLLVAGGAPRWATGKDQPAGGPYGQWKPSATQYGQFMQAIATRYSGGYSPCSSCSTLPRVSAWEIWNEPNWGPSLAPQEPAGYSASVYRNLLDAGWSSLQRTGHGGDTIVVGSLSPRGFNHPNIFSTTKPMQFVRWLYCVNSSYRQLRGSTASHAGCPTTAAGSRRFRSQHPGLFGASAFGIHPYPFDLPPNRADSRDPDYVEFNEIPRLAAGLDRLLRTYGSGKRLQIFNTEYGYETNPPNRTNHFVSPNTAAAYINWAEYLSWKNPRLATTMQYLLKDPNPNVGRAVFGFGSFAAGLVFYHGGPKADYFAYRMPLFLPSTSTRRNRSLEVWGCARPAHFASGPQSVQIQFRRGSHGAFRTVRTLTLHSSQGYFDVKLTFPASGAVRTAWKPPQGATIHSRSVNISIR